MSAITRKVLELVQSLPLADQETIAAELGKSGSSAQETPRRRLQRLPDGSYYNPDGIPNDDPIFKILEEIEAERHQTPGPPAPEFN